MKWRHGPAVLPCIAAVVTALSACRNEPKPPSGADITRSTRSLSVTPAAEMSTPRKDFALVELDSDRVMAQTLTDELLTIAEEDSIAPAMDWVAEPVARVLTELDPDFARLSADHGEHEGYFATVLHPLFYSLLFRAEA